MPAYDYTGFQEVVMKSAKAPLPDQTQRSSGNYLFTTEVFKSCNKIRWSCPAGVSFDVMKDHTGGKDDVLQQGVCNGSETSRIDGKGIYIANPKGASVDFEIRVTAL